MTRRLPQTITREEFARLLRQPSRRAPTGIRNAAMLAVMFDCGLRVSEVCGLAYADVIRTGKSAPALRVRRGKGDKDRGSIPIPPETWALMERWERIRGTVGKRFYFCSLQGERMSDRYIRAMVARYAQRAGVYKLDADNRERPINPHMLRHSYATRLIEGGAPIHAVQRALGHASVATTERYLHVNDAKLAGTLLAALDDANGDGDRAALRRIVREELQALTHGR